jgi:hypothetical protein
VVGAFESDLEHDLDFEELGFRLRGMLIALLR